MTKPHLLTGATGFIGGAVLLELLRRTDAEIYCLVRPRPGADGEARLAAALGKTTRAYGEESLLAAAKERCRVIEGDITLPGCGVAPSQLPAIAAVWHTAASLAFEEEREAEIMRENVGGVEAMVELSAAAGADCFNHFSTAYVAGNRVGAIEESLADLEVQTNNAYERSKVRGERFVVAAPIERVRIFRPGIVVGHSDTLAATAFTGLYGFARNMVQLRDEVHERLGDYLLHRPLNLIGDPTVPLNLIPVDTVAEAAVAIAGSGSEETIFHLTNAVGVPVGLATQTITEAVGIRTPRWAMDRDLLTSIDTEVDERMVFYSSYLRNAKQFDRSHTERAIGAGALERPVVHERLADLVDWSMPFLDPERRSAAAAPPTAGAL